MSYQTKNCETFGRFARLRHKGPPMDTDAHESETDPAVPAPIHRRQKYPLAGPAAAIAAGILAYRFVPVPQSQLLLAIGALLLLGALSLHRNSRILAGTCCLLGLFFGGEL